MSSRDRSLLSPGHADEWSRLNAEKRSLLRPSREASVETLLRQGMELSAQAAALLTAVESADDAPAGPSA